MKFVTKTPQSLWMQDGCRFESLRTLVIQNPPNLADMGSPASAVASSSIIQDSLHTGYLQKAADHHVGSDHSHAPLARNTWRSRVAAVRPIVMLRLG
jgi:hypothetical protein